ncbi:MAG: hypothetical protein AAF471_07190 [Myxococcota bacterium]
MPEPKDQTKQPPTAAPPGELDQERRQTLKKAYEQAPNRAAFNSHIQRYGTAAEKAFLKKLSQNN